MKNSQQFDSVVSGLQRELLGSDDPNGVIDSGVVDNRAFIASILAETRDLPQHIGDAVVPVTQPSRWLSFKSSCLSWLAPLSLNAKFLNRKFTKPFAAMFIAVVIVTGFTPFFTPELIPEQPRPSAELANVLEVDLTLEEWWLAEDELLFLDAS